MSHCHLFIAFFFFAHDFHSTKAAVSGFGNKRLMRRVRWRLVNASCTMAPRLAVDWRQHRAFSRSAEARVTNAAPDQSPCCTHAALRREGGMPYMRVVSHLSIRQHRHGFILPTHMRRSSWVVVNIGRRRQTVVSLLKV